MNRTDEAWRHLPLAWQWKNLIVFKPSQQLLSCPIRSIHHSPSRKAFANGRETIRQAYLKKWTPLVATDVMMASLTDLTIKQYTSPLKRWWNFCNNLDRGPYNGNTELILALLTEWFNVGASYGTLNSARSAISLISFYFTNWSLISFRFTNLGGFHKST